MNTDSAETIIVCNVCGARNRILPQNVGRVHVCGQCKTPLHEFRSVTKDCVICGDECGIQDQFLSDGSVYHQMCYEETIREIQSIDQQTSSRQAEVGTLKSAIQTELSLVSRLTRFFSGGVSKVAHWQNKIQALEKETEVLEAERLDWSGILTDIYDYWLTYPPDWNERRTRILRYARACENCGSPRGPLHIHHENPISRGGSHRAENLCVLCEKCHEMQHGDRPFQYSDDTQPGPFARKLRVLRDAIGSGKFVHFAYRKYEGAESVRSIKPSDFKTVKGSLCIVGYCYLRKAERTFAIRRMKEMKIVEMPGPCYDKG